MDVKNSNFFIFLKIVRYFYIKINYSQNTRKSARHGYIIITDLKTGDVHEIEINQETKPEN